MTDKCREEFEKYLIPPKEYSFEDDGDGYQRYQKLTEKGVVTAEPFNSIFKAFQAAYKLREQEIQRLREVLGEFIILVDSIDNHTKESLYQWVIVLGRNAKQALQQELTTKE